jgi:hypothetical protein
MDLLLSEEKKDHAGYKMGEKRHRLWKTQLKSNAEALGAWRHTLWKLSTLTWCIMTSGGVQSEWYIISG